MHALAAVVKRVYNRLVSLISMDHRRVKILVYNGKGSCDEIRGHLLQSLETAVDNAHHTVTCISPEEIKKGFWTDTCRLIVFGGGYDLGIIEALGNEGTSCIQKFVENGGSYLGLCAGAYWASDTIEFDKGGPLQVVGERLLKFFPGKCIGPAYPGFQYDSKKGLHAVKVLYRDKHEFYGYMNGGGYFVLYKNEDSDSSVPSRTNGLVNSVKGVDLLAKYCCLANQPAAIVKCSVGQGLAILSAVHLEVSLEMLKEESPKDLISHFRETEKIRNDVFLEVLKQLKVQVQHRY